MEEKSLKGNFIYTLLLSTFSIVYPIITSSIILDAIGPSNNGIVVSMTAFLEFFVVLSVFGTDRYGVREVPLIKNDPKKLSQLFSELIFIKTIAAVLMFTIMVIYITTTDISENEKKVLAIFSINILGTIFSMDWFYQGIERFKFITLRVVGFRIVALILIILFVNNQDDFIIYAIILVITTNLNNITNFFYSRKYTKIKFEKLRIKKHIKTLCLFCFFAVLVLFTTSFDLWFLGKYSLEDATYLSKARQINLVAFALANSLSIVVIPRASLYFKTDKKQYTKLVKKSYNFIIMFALFIAIMVMILSKNIMFILGSFDIIGASSVLFITAPVIIFYLINKWLQSQLLVPIGKEKLLLIIMGISAFISVTLNIIFVPKFGYMGSATIMLIVELFTLAITLLLVNKMAHIKVKSLKLINVHLIRCVIAAAAMLVGLLLIIWLYNLVWVNLLENNPIISNEENTSIYYNLIYCAFMGVAGTTIFGFVLIKLKDSFAIEVFEYTKQKLQQLNKRSK